MLATLARRAPARRATGSFEVKFDGYRALAYVRGGECTLVSRNDNDLTERFSGGREGDRRRRSKSPNAVVDGEICRIDPSGRASFSELQQGTGPLVFYAFDLLELDGEPLVDLPLHGAQGAAARAARRARQDGRASRRASTTATRCSRSAQERGLEGVIAKRARQRLQAGQAHARLAEDQDREQRRVRRRRLHPRRRAARGHVRRRSCSPSTRAASCATSATSAPASTTPRSASC